MPIRPPSLKPGDTLGIVSPASPAPDPRNIDRAAANLENLGFKIKFAPNVRKRHGFLAGSDRDRASDLMRMFSDDSVSGILCVRGGYGTARLLNLLDYKIIRANPKVFIGYSDITALHCAFLKKANLISFHGPMLNSDFSDDNMPDFSLQGFLRVLQKHKWPRSISESYQGDTIKILRRGLARGQLIGGNLSIICTMIGTPWQPAFQGRILFLEDLGEQPYRVDRMLTHLLNCGLLQQVAGIAIGVNKDCEDPRAKQGGEYRQTLEDVFRDRLRPLKVPVVIGLPFGHVPLNATLPVGASVLLDGNRGDLII
jgi:muramoyltetrapeptide carboxypeptidase